MGKLKSAITWTAIVAIIYIIVIIINISRLGSEHPPLIGQAVYVIVVLIIVFCIDYFFYYDWRAKMKEKIKSAAKKD